MPPRPVKKAVPAAPPPPERGTLDDQDDYINIMLYGEPGAGKTTSALYMAKQGRVLLINAEGGAKRRALVRHGIPMENIEVFPAKGQTLTYQSLNDLFWEIRAKLFEEPEAYVGVVWDSVTEIHKLLLEQVTAREVAKAVRKQERAGLEPDVDPFFVDRSYYGTMTEQMRKLIRQYRDLPCHVAFTALARRDEDKNTGETFYGPALTPALSGDLQGYVDIVCRQYINQGVYLGSFIQEGIKIAKDRLGGVPLVMVDPTFERIQAYVMGELDAASDPLQKKVPQAVRKASARAAAKLRGEKAAGSDSGRR